MIIRRFLLWARQAPPGHRAEAVTALANAYLHSDLSAADRAEAEIGLTAMLDDPSTLVRRAMAEVLAPSPAAPRHVMVALASDATEIAAIVLGRSPLLSDGDLVDAAALGDIRMQVAIAGREAVSPSVSAALAEIGTAEALVALAGNPEADIPEFSLGRAIERHGDHAPLREALLARPDLPLDIAQAIASSLAAELGRFVTGCGWLSAERSGRVTQEARDRTTVALSGRADQDSARRLVEHLRRSGQLTPGLMLRAILSCRMALVEAAFVDLSGMPPARVAAILRDGRSSAFRAFYGRAGLPETLRPAFEAALAVWRAAPGEAGHGPGPSRRMVEQVLAACEKLPPEEAGRLVAFLRRFEAEAARDDARRAAADLADEAALAIVLANAPEALALAVEPRNRRAA